MNIPKIIHHIAPQDSSRWHPLWARCRQSWLDQFAGFEFRLWNDADDIDELVRSEYPQYWQLYQDFQAQHQVEGVHDLAGLTPNDQLQILRFNSELWLGSGNPKHHSFNRLHARFYDTNIMSRLEEFV